MTDRVRPLGYMFQAIEALLRLGHGDVAAEAIDTVAHLYPDVLAVQLYRGWLQIMQNRPDQAVAAFRLAVGRDPTDPFAWHGLAETTQDAAERSIAADRARLLNPEGPQAQLWYDLHNRKPHLAVTALHAFSRRFPERPELTIWLAETQRRLHNETQAQLLLEPLLRRRPRPVPALFLAAALAEDGTTALQYLNDALRLDPLAMSARRLFAPDGVPFQLPPPPMVVISPALEAALEELGSDIVPIPPRPLPQRSRAHTSVPKSAEAAPVLTATPAAPAVPPSPASSAPIDPDTQAALSAVEQAAQRLFGRTPLANESGPATALLVTHRSALETTYGGETAAAIVEAIETYGAALASRNIHAEIVLVDQREALNRFGNVPPAGEQTAAACKQVIDAVRAAVETAGREVDAVILIGGDAIVPFHRLANPSQDADNDVPSDNPYGAGGGSELAPELIVARFPDGGPDGGRMLLEHLQRAAEYHHNWHLAGPGGGVLTLPFMRRFNKAGQAGGPVVAWGASAAAWQVPSQTIFNELGNNRPLMICPPATPDAIEAAWPAEGRLLYFNLHGLPGGPNWYGQAVDGPEDEPLPVALTPDDIGSIAPAMICMTEACYGAEIIGRTPADAIALRMLHSGALAFVGSTVTSYGAVALPLGGADLLTQQTLQNLRRGHPLGRAVLLARDWMAREMVERQGYLDPDDAKTLLSFVLLGDPWATPYTRPVLERKTSLPQITPVVVQRRPVAANMVAPAAVNVARQLIAKVAPNMARATLSAVGQGRPDRIAKGQASAVVFSATGELPTTDGLCLPQVARVTVAGGEARKLLLSR